MADFLFNKYDDVEIPLKLIFFLNKEPSPYQIGDYHKMQKRKGGVIGKFS
jgi:hypothetical protein